MTTVHNGYWCCRESLYFTNYLKQMQIIMGKHVLNKKIRKEIQRTIQKQSIRRPIIENNEKHMHMLSYLK